MHVMKKSILLITIFIVSSVIYQTGSLSLVNWDLEVDTQSMYSDIDNLSSDEFQGRFSGSEGALLAEKYIVSKLNASDIQPVIGGSYYQDFSLPFWSQPIDVNVTIAGTELQYITDYVEATLTGRSNISNPTEIIFCGYGIDSQNYNDYINIDVNEKIVLISTGVPSMVSDNYAYTGSKIKIAANHGASGLIIVNHPSLGTVFKKSTATISGFEQNIATIIANRSIINKYINFTSLMNDLDEFLGNNPNYYGEKSMTSGINATMKVLIDYRENVHTANILGKLKGNTDNYIIISSHYDHLGMTAINQPYPGADDDGSGVAVTLELARVLSKYAKNNELPISIIFAFWSSEELGLIGSNYFINNLPFSRDQIQLVLHLDMVGVGPSDGYLFIDGGLLLSAQDQNYLIQSGKDAQISNVRLNELGGGSDHISFYYINRPAVMLFWDDLSVHSNYHTVLDTVNDINTEILMKVTVFILSYLFSHNNNSNSTGSVDFSIESIFLALIVIIFYKKRSFNL